MSIELVHYGIDNDNGQYIGPWMILKITTPDGDGAEELLGPDDARGLATNLLDVARMLEERAAARTQKEIASP